MASAFLPPSSAPSSVFTIRPRTSSKSSFTYAAPHIPAIAEPQHNDKFVDGDAPFLSDVECDLDMSNMSIGSPPSSPPLRSNELPAGSHFLLPPQTQRYMPSSPVPMDISPAPRRIASTMRVISPSERLASTKGLSGRALVQELFRGFGTDVANISNTNTVSSSFLRSASTLKPTRSNSPPHSQRGASVAVSNTSRTRAGLPSAWLQNTEPASSPDHSATPGRPKLGRNRSQTMIDPRKEEARPVPAAVPSAAAAPVAWDTSISYDDMDVEMDLDGDASVAHSVTAPSSPAGPLPTEFNELFFQPSSPVLEASSPGGHGVEEPRSPEAEGFVEFDLEEEIAHAQQEELRRSGRGPSPEKAAIFSSSPPTSPSRPIRPGPGIGLGRPFERSATTGGQGSLFGSLAQAQAQQALPKRTLVPRRPVLSTIVPDGTNSLGPSSRSLAPPPARRAFSACVTSSALVMGSPVTMEALGSDDSQELDGSPARAYATRKAAPSLRRDLLPTRAKAESKPAQSSPLTRLGLPGFGDNEADGKILPCHKVREDGLMRINCDTLDALLAGHFDSQIQSYTVIDCRFEYEYEGGHIPGAINLNTTQAIEDHLLGDNKPAPSRSGDNVKKHILVFHCEFSVKRAPTFAKHLRSRDRALNSHSYPKVHYPEVYIMEGGFSRYFKEKPSQVDPPYSYVQMDDPVHLRARHSDLNNFRKWERTKSYTYGEKQAAAAAIAQGQRAVSSGSSSNRTSASTSATSSTSSSLSRRMGHAMGHAGSLSTLDEDGDSIADIEETSPCPPSAANYLRPGLLGGKPGGIGRIAMSRAASFGFATTKR
ncbi:Rhodanese domain-containing protein [Ceratobasidium sp. AG-Ba]|nr:Rhodanese domain-containing protein [Ceratobasidium sp. AG-Ba]